jgi:hypothetical protein
LKLEENIQLGNLIPRRKGNIKMELLLKKRGVKIDWTYKTQNRNQRRAFLKAIINLRGLFQERF